MGCGVSKDDIAEPRPMKSHGRHKVQLTGKREALKPIQAVTSVNDPASCISSLYISSSVINNPASPPSIFIHTPDSVSSDEDESDVESSYEYPSNLSIEEVDEKESRTTALAALSGEEGNQKTRTDKEDVEERVQAILTANELLNIEYGQECSTSPLGMLSGAAFFQALMSTVPVIAQKNLAGDLPQAREEPDAGEVLMLENTHEKQEDQSDQEHEPLESPQPAELAKLAEPDVPEHEQENSDEESASYLTEQPEEQPKQEALKLDDAVDTHKDDLSCPEPRKAKLPPLTIVPPILVETQALPFVHPFGKPALPIVVKKDLLEVKIPAAFEAEQFEDPYARTPHLVGQESANGAYNLDMSKSSPETEPCETPTPATKSPADSEWRSLHRDTPDPDIEDIVLLESQGLGNLESLPLIPVSDCHSVHMDKKDLISPSLRLIS
ncbi:hypothetical protein KC19_1G129500 [Ceratodon purpureus]|uniref:Uncharacterized protein n=1 Tax=Ceratodon purpureus TaxID=3225 RepID=A0A8T0J5M8_CERPU|nr:hypothetical protein KC19_1G129500 [Ceratodon purpureus]